MNRKPRGYDVHIFDEDCKVFRPFCEYGASPIRDHNSRIAEVRRLRSEGERVKVLPFHIDDRFRKVHHEEITE